LGGGPFNPIRSSSGFRFGWLFFAIFAFVAISVIGGVVAVFYNVSHTISTVESNFPSFTGLPSTPGDSSSDPITAGNDVDVAGSGKTVSLVCDGGSVSILGTTNTVDITGHCAKVTVSGVKNKITVESADAIETSGMTNTVTYHSGSPQINKSGLDNSVEQG
jgi:hypothetical protein